MSNLFYRHPPITGAALAQPGSLAETLAESLSRREVEVLRWLTSGASNREIGRRLSITESTVKRHIYNIFGKLNVRNRTQAALQARKLGIAPHVNLPYWWEERQASG